MLDSGINTRESDVIDEEAVPKTSTTEEKSLDTSDDFTEPYVIDKVDDSEDEDKDKKTLTSSIFESLVYIAISLAIIMIIRTFVVQHVRVDGTSMVPTLQDNEHLLIEKLSYRFDSVDRFDIIVFKPYESNKKVLYVKRVIGLPNETVYIKDDVIYIDGKPLEENYGGDAVTEEKDMTEPVKLGKDEYFVLGDNRVISKDSRDNEVGTVSFDSIVGKAWYVIFPFSNLGKIEHK